MALQEGGWKFVWSEVCALARDCGPLVSSFPPLPSPSCEVNMLPLPQASHYAVLPHQSPKVPGTTDVDWNFLNHGPNKSFFILSCFISGICYNHRKLPDTIMKSWKIWIKVFEKWRLEWEGIVYLICFLKNRGNEKDSCQYDGHAKLSRSEGACILGHTNKS
jgi:hypothetical protein